MSGQTVIDAAYALIAECEAIRAEAKVVMDRYGLSDFPPARRLTVVPDEG